MASWGTSSIHIQPWPGERMRQSPRRVPTMEDAGAEEKERPTRPTGKDGGNGGKTGMVGVKHGENAGKTGISWDFHGIFMAAEGENVGQTMPETHPFED